MRKLGEKLEFKDVTSVCVTQRVRATTGAVKCSSNWKFQFQGDIVLADTRIMVFDSRGNFIREFGWKSLKEGCRGRYQVIISLRAKITVQTIQFMYQLEISISSP